MFNIFKKKVEEIVETNDIDKEKVRREFMRLLKENPLKMLDECIRQVKDFRIVGERKKGENSYDIDWEYHFYDGEIFENTVSATRGEEKKLAMMFYKHDLYLMLDPLEYNPEVKKKIRLAEKEAKEILSKKTRKDRFNFWGFRRHKVSKNWYVGDCHILWAEQKRILKEKYNIDWKTQSELHPGARFD